MFFKKLKIFVVFLLVFLEGSQSQKQFFVSGDYCKTRYPIILVHGVAYRDDIKLLPYWSRIPIALKQNGATVYLSHTQAFNSHADNAVILKNRILQILEETGAEKVNIIAHSKGGLESRWMISRLDMADKVASLTTMATPHKGSFLADTILSSLETNEQLDVVLRVARLYATLIGDQNPEVLQAAKNLTVDYMKNFNESCPPAPQVYYQSFGVVQNSDYPLKMLFDPQQILLEKEGPNDSQVSLESSKYGNFNYISAPDEFGMSHFDVVGMKFISKTTTFDAEKFYINIVKDLKEKGF